MDCCEEGGGGNVVPQGDVAIKIWLSSEVPNEASPWEEGPLLNTLPLMSYFLRNFPHPLDELATLLGHGHEDEHQMFQAVRCKWMDLLEKASERRFGKWRQLRWGREHGKKADVFCSQNAAQKRNQSENERNECQQQQQQENWENAEAKQRLMLVDTALDSLDVMAAPSAFGADAIAQAIVYRLCGIFGEEDGTDSPPIETSDCTNPAAEWAINRNRGRPFSLNTSPKNKTAVKAPDLVGIGLESLFSVLLELNRREPDLCARSLQSLLQLLQVLEAGTLGTQPRAMLARMHELLRELRREGNAQVSAVANACMMSLAVASGHPEFLFAAVYALLCEPKRYVPFNQLASSTNLLPRNLQSMALTVQRHLLKIKPGQDSRWMSDPLEHRPLVCEFDVIYTGSALFEDHSDGICRGCLTSDGAFVYLLTVYGFFKLGTGLCETRAGEVLVCNEAVRFNDGSSLYVSNGSLYLRHRHSARLWVLDTETLREIGEIMLPSALVSQGLLFSDGRQFWLAALDDQWHLVCTPLDDSFAPMSGEQSPNSADGDGCTAAANPPRTQPSQVRLMECEFCAFGELEETHEQMLRSIPAKLRGITADLQLGPGIGFLLSRCGKVFFAGPASDSDFGLCSPPPVGCWTRLNVPEPIVSMALESNSQTLVLRSGAGNLWRQPSKETTAPVARRLKVPNKKKCVSVSVASVGGGSLALVTESGRVFLLGRHVLNNAQHAQATLQQMSPHANAQQSVLGMENIALAQVALGKTHLAGIAKNGALYATGLNNQNQCGRTGEQQQNQQEKSRAQSASQAGARPSEFSAISSNSQSVSSSNSSSCCQFCSLSQHLFVDDLASLCVRCGQCSARGSACPFSKSKSGGGTACACARSGPSCCVRCGLCKECVQTDRRAHAARKQASPKAVRLQQLTTARGTTLCKAPLAREEGISEPGRARRTETEEGMSGAITSGTTRVFPPERVLLQPQPNIKVSTVSVGNFHTVVLSADNQVYTFGANTHGQLGTGDTKSLTGVHKLAFPANIQIVQAVAGANHSVLRTIDGRLITFGAHKAGQLGRKRIATPASSPSGVTAVRQWFAEPGFVPGFGQAYGRLANWASAQGDRTVVQVQQQLISRAELADGRITASGDVLMVLPSVAGRAQQHKNNTRGYFMVGWNNNGTGTATGDRMALLRFRHRIWPTRQAQKTELDLGLCSFCFDPRHLNLLWAYDPVRMRVFALSDVPPPTGHGQEANEPQSLLKHRQMVMRSTELMVPTSVEDESEFDQQGSTEISQARFSDVQLAIFLLSTVHTLCLAISAGAKQQELPNKIDQCAKSDDSEVVGLDTDCAAASLDGVIRSMADRDCRVVRRFENFGGGWGYSAHCVEAIQFMTNKEVMFCGVGLFGGRGEYTARLKLYRAIEDEVETEETEQQHCVELLAETDEVLYECAPRETATLQLERPIPIRRSRWHLIWVQIQGPSSDCGAGGQEAVQVEMSADTENTSDSLVELHFRATPLSNNGTNVEVGQIPELYFLPVMVGEGEEPCSTAARDDGSTRKFKPKSANSDHSHDHDHDHLLIVSVSPLFHNICPSSIQQLLHIIEWALEGAFRPGTEETGELINCDALWRQERAAFVAVLAVRLIRHFLHVPSGDRAHPEGLVAFHRLLKCILSRQSLGQDNCISTFVMAEAALAYTILAYKFAPNPALFRMRLVDQITRKRENAAKNWWLLALLCSMRRMKKNLLQIIKISSAAANEKDAKGQKRRSAEMAERVWRDEQSANVSWQSDECPPLAILKFLCEIAFGEMSDDLEEENGKNVPMGRQEGAGGYDAISGEESDNNRTARGINIPEEHSANRLPDRLNSVAQHLIASIGHLLITRALPRPKTRGGTPPLFQSPSRFRHISPQAQWEVGANQQASAWDAVAFRVEGHGIALAGAGIFSGSSTGPEQFELELMQNQCPTAADSASGERNWRLVERVTGRPDTFPTQIVNFARLCTLKPGICYAVKVRFGGAGKTLYGEGGILSVQLRDQIRLHFLPCDLSRNGTTVSRGQFPFLLFSVVDEEDKSAGGAEGEEEEEKAVEREKSPAEELFLHLLRQIVQRISRRMVHRTTASEDLLRPGEQRMCAALLGLANVWVEGRPRRAFDVVAVLDEATPILAHVNAAAGEEQDGHGLDFDGSASSASSSSSGINLVAVDSKLPLKANFCSSTSSSAPSQIHQINVPHSDFLCVHFDSQCQTAQPTDSVWVYVKGNGGNILPVANFHGRNWPRGQLLVPGDRLWVILESGPRQLENDHNNAFGFRCSVEPISAQKANSVQPNVSLERHFVWCLSNACRALLGSGGRCGQLQMNNKSLHELLARHGCLLLRGMHFGLPNGTMPSMAQLTEQSEFGVDQQQGTKELVFLKEFAEGQHPELSAFLCHQPVVSLVNSFLKIVGPEDVRVGNPVEINFVVRDQHKREVTPVGQLEVTVTLSSGAMEGSAEDAEGGTTDWGGLKAEQTKIAFRPVPCGRALYQCVSAIAQFAHWSLEELRFAFVFTRPLRNRLRLYARGDKSEILSAIWTPQRVGTYLLQCAVDGIALSGQIIVLEVREGQNRRSENPTNSLRAQNFAHSDVKQFANANAKVDSGPPLKSAHFPASSPFFALKVRVHCSLSAPQLGLVHRGSSLQYAEVLRNEDGIWLRITEETKREILGIGNKVQMESEAWVLQLNAHLQTEFLQLCPSPSDDGNFLVQQPPPQLQQLSTTATKRCLSPVTISILDSPKFRKGKKAISPQLFEAFRWVFVAAAWHSLETDGCTAEELIKAAQSLLEFGSSGQRRGDCLAKA
uniref:4Fe-4S ferredoxin-type domain-containing protein n=1 Tax=Globodera rostochiensis TaxID=31243 RepID=A0A914IDA9_GLORO